MTIKFPWALAASGIKNPVQEKSYRGRFFSYYAGLAKAELTSYKALNYPARAVFVVLTIVPAIFVTLGAIAIDVIKGSFQSFSNLKNKIMKRSESKLDKVRDFVKSYKVELSVGVIALIAAGIYFKRSDVTPTVYPNLLEQKIFKNNVDETIANRFYLIIALAISSPLAYAFDR